MGDGVFYACLLGSGISHAWVPSNRRDPRTHVNSLCGLVLGVPRASLITADVAREGCEECARLRSANR